MAKRLDFTYADRKLNDLADVLVSFRKLDEEKFMEALKQYSDYLREISWEEGKLSGYQDGYSIGYDEGWSEGHKEGSDGEEYR